MVLGPLEVFRLSQVTPEVVGLQVAAEQADPEIWIFCIVGFCDHGGQECVLVPAVKTSLVGGRINS